MRLKNKTNDELRIGWSGMTIVVPPLNGPQRGSTDCHDDFANALKTGHYAQFRDKLLWGPEALRADEADFMGASLAMREKALGIEEAGVALMERQAALDEREKALAEREARIAAMLSGDASGGPGGQD